MKYSKPDDKANSTSRRSFIKTVGGAAAASLAGIAAADARAAELPRLDESDPTAVALKYVHDASSLDSSLRPQKDRWCYNCALYSGEQLRHPPAHILWGQ